MARKFNLWHKTKRGSKTRPSLAKRRRGRTPLRAPALGMELLEDRWMLAAGSLDTTFNPAGAVPGTLIASLGFIEEGQSVAVQADGKILIAGRTQTISGSSSTSDFAVARFMPNGDLDTTFGVDLDGVNGLAKIDFFNKQDTGYDLLIDSSNRILVVGQATSASDNFGVGITRLTSSGLLDTTFGTLGKSILTISGSVVDARAAALQSDGKIVVTGSTRAGVASTTNFLTVRFTATGALDTATFNPGVGYVVTDFNGARDEAFDVAVQSDGKIVVGGQATTGGIAQFGLVRYNSNGTLDTVSDGFDPGQFGTNGFVRTNVSVIAASGADTDTIESIIIQPDGRIVVAGHTDIGGISASDAVVARYNVDGSLDTTFNSSGVQPGVLGVNITDAETGDAIVRQSNGDYVVAGRSTIGVGASANERLMVFRVLASSGQLDPSFGTGGITLTNLAAGTTVERHRDVAMTPDGKIVAGGQYNTGNATDFVLARYESGLVIASIAGPATTNEGATYTLTTTATDPTIIKWTINWGDGSASEDFLGNPASVDHVYLDGNAGPSHVITASFTTPVDTFMVGNTVTVAVQNVAPTLTVANSTVTTAEGATVTNSGTYGDVPADTVTLTASIGSIVYSAGAWSWSYTPTDNAPPQTVTITASDEDGGSTPVTFQLAVNNVAPSLVLSGASNVNEGAGYTLNLSSSDPGSDTITQWTINWGDGIEVISGNPASVSHTYADGDANYVISATATDEDGTFTAGNTVAVAVDNVAPTLTISGASDVNEGDAYTLNLSSSDAGTDTITQWTINWGDGIEVISGNPASVSHTYADGEANYVISATAADEDGTFAAENTVVVSVHDVAPTLTLSGAADVDEAASYTLNLSSADSGTDTITQWTIDWGDATEVVSGNPSSVSHTYADGDANYIISATATDEDGIFAADNTVAVTVHNVAPTLMVDQASVTTVEGTAVTNSGTFGDVAADTVTLTASVGSISYSAGVWNWSYTPTDNAPPQTVTITASDEDGGSTPVTFQLVVNNVAPTLAISGAPDVGEGSVYTLNLSSSDPGDDTISEWTIDWGDAIEVVTGNPTSVTHTYADGPSSYAISATATDEDGTFSAGSVVVAVLNVAPLLAISGAANVDEGSSYTLSLSSSDPGQDTITQWTINWGDSVEIVSGNPGSVTHTYADGDANYTISATATDEDGTFSAGNTVAVAVHNLAPTLTVDQSTVTTNEGSVVTNSGTFGDVSADTVTLTASVGSISYSAGAWSWSYTPTDNAPPQTVTITATDEDGGSTPVTFQLTVNNVAPTLALSGAASVNEGSSYTLNLSSSDSGTDTITQWTINWGDSTQVVSGSPSSVAHTYADGTTSYTISATATDEDGTYAAGNTVGVTVQNVAPTLAISGASSVSEGSTYTLNLSSSDPGADTISQWTINWGDSTQVVTGNPSSVTHVYADGTVNRTISATATDEDGAYAASNTVAVTVNNVAPTLAISGAANVNEGSTYTLNLSSSDPGADTISQWTINWGDGIQVVTGNPSSVTHVYADGNASSHYTITATATDEDGTYAAGNTVAVNVLNVAPTANTGGPYQTFDDTPIMLSGSGADPAGAADPLTFKWDLDGDGIFGETGSGATRGNEVGANVTYNPTGLGNTTQTVKLQVSDGDGGVTVATTTVQIQGQGTLLVGGVLYIVGSNSNDIVAISKIGSCIVVLATFNSNNPMTFNESAVTEIQVRMRGGNDIVVTTPNVTKTMTIDGGAGNDLLTGGGGRNLILGGAGNDVLYGDGGDDVLLGGDGNDDLFGGSGNDVLVGGNGNDILSGGTGRDVMIGSQDDDCLDGGSDEDVLIGGVTIHDSNVAALDAVMAIWGSSASFSSRVATLTSSGGLLQAGVAVFDDDDRDTLVGGAGRDLYFGDNNPWDGVVDSITLQSLQDQLIAVT